MIRLVNCDLFRYIEIIPHLASDKHDYVRKKAIMYPNGPLESHLHKILIMGDFKQSFNLSAKNKILAK